jgi:hypothetical protein
VRKGVIALFAALVAVAVAPAQADAVLTAKAIRIGNHPAFVRVVVDFTGGSVGSADVEATDTVPFFDGKARVRVSKPGIDTNAPARSRFGVSARLVQGTNQIVLRLSGAVHRFKYLGYVTYAGPQRLVVDLWKARPPVAGAVFTTAPQGGCLTLDSWSVGAGAASAAGHEQDLFEHMFQVVLRKAGGQVARSVGVTSSGGAWSRSFSYSVAGQQSGTLEAVDFSAKDGSLVCIVQVRVTLRPPP